MATFKEISAADIQTTQTALSQLVDVIQTDISSSATRKTYQMFVTASTDENAATYSVTSSLFQTVFDQDYTLQVSNPIFDMTVGLFYSSSTVMSSSLGEDSSGKMLFPSSSMMMREKVDIYKMHAGKLLGDNEAAFFSPVDSTATTDQINEAIFINFRRLFARDKIKRETFAMRMYTTGVLDGDANASAFEQGIANGYTGSNLDITSPSGSTIFTDVGSSAQRRSLFGGEVGSVVDSSDSTKKVGLVFYDAGIVILDAAKVIWGDQHVSGTISAVTGTDATAPSLVNATVIGSALDGANPAAKFIPDFFVSASIDDVVDHFASTRFQSGSFSAMTFQNQTQINSTIFFCRATADEFNYSANPTFRDDENRIVVIEEGQEDIQRTFSFPTTIGMYDANNNLLAVAKFSRPIEKNDEKDLTVRVRLDF